MSVYAKISPLNPLRMVEKDVSFTDERGRKPFGVATFLDGLTNQEVNEPYYQPFKRDGLLTLQFIKGEIDGNQINFYSEYGDLLHSVNGSTLYQTLSGLTDPDTGDQLYVYKAEAVPSLYSELDDYDLVYVELQVDFGSGSKYFISSAPVKLFIDNEGFSEIEYSNNTNDYDLYFENKNALYYPTFKFWVEADRVKKISAGEYTVFDDMNQKLSKLYGKTYDKYNFEVGGCSNGVPEYMIDIVDRIMMCDNIRVDGRKYVLEESGESGSDKPLQVKNYVIRESEPEDKYTFRQREIELWARPTSGFPYAVGRILLENNGTNPIEVTARILDDSTEEAALIALINARATTATASGTAALSGTTVIFTNADGENWTKSNEVVVCPKEFTMLVNVPNNGDVFRYVTKYPTTSIEYYHIANFGDDATISGDTLQTSVSGTTTATHTYPLAAPTRTVRVFHNNEEIELDITAVNPVGGAKMVGQCTGVVSNTLKRILIRSQNLTALATFDLDFLQSAADTLEFMFMTNSTIQGFTAGWASSLVSGGYKPFVKMRWWEVGNNNSFNATYVDEFINEIYNSTAWSAGNDRVLITFGQSPSAPPTGASSTARAAFIANFWFVSTD